MKGARTDDFALIEVLWSVGRSVKVKKKLLDELMACSPPLDSIPKK